MPCLIQSCMMWFTFKFISGNSRSELMRMAVPQHSTLVGKTYLKIIGVGLWRGHLGYYLWYMLKLLLVRWRGSNTCNQCNGVWIRAVIKFWVTCSLFLHIANLQVCYKTPYKFIKLQLKVTCHYIICYMYSPLFLLFSQTLKTWC